MSDIITFSNSQITQISHLFGDELMSGSEITRIFTRLGIEDNSGQSTKWRRLEYAFTERQNRDRSGNMVLRFIQESLSPVSYVQNQSLFNDSCDKLNQILAFSGIEYKNDGQFMKVKKAKTISDAQKRVESILTKLRQRDVHSRVLYYCNEELLKENYFHAVFEAAKSLSDHIRTITNLKEDGSELFDKALSTKNPYLLLNDLQSESKRNQQVGLMMMLKGINSMVRNVTAHEAKIKWVVNEDDAVDILSTISFLHKNLDECQVIKIEQ